MRPHERAGSVARGPSVPDGALGRGALRRRARRWSADREAVPAYAARVRLDRGGGCRAGSTPSAHDACHSDARVRRSGLRVLVVSCGLGARPHPLRPATCLERIARTLPGPGSHASAIHVFGRRRSRSAASGARRCRPSRNGRSCSPPVPGRRFRGRTPGPSARSVGPGRAPASRGISSWC